MRKFAPAAKRFVSDVRTKAAIVSGAVVASCSPMAAFAVNTSSANWSGGSNINTLISSVIGMILGLAQGIGIILLIFGVFRLVLASKDGNSNEQAQGYDPRGAYAAYC